MNEEAKILARVARLARSEFYDLMYGVERPKYYSDEDEDAFVAAAIDRHMVRVGFAHSILCSDCTYDPHGRKENERPYWTKPGLTTKTPDREINEKYERFEPIYRITQEPRGGEDGDS